MTDERNIYELVTKLHQAEAARDELAAELRTLKEQLRIAEQILEERLGLAKR